MQRPANNESKLAWCERGERMEEYFVREIAPRVGIQLKINPAKSKDPYTYDLVGGDRGQYKVDLKYVETPFFKAGTYGFDPGRTVTFNHKDYLRYMYLYPDLWVLFYVTWEEQLDYGILVPGIEGIWIAPIKLIDKLITERRTGFHAYQKREHDNQGNAKASHLISLDDLTCRWKGARE